MSTPLVARRPDDTAPSLRGSKGLICPKCRRRFDEDGPEAQTHCPDDKSVLVLVRDMADADGDPMLGRTLDGRYTILARLGAGSMGTVYRAKQHAVGRDVAVKILRSDRAVDGAAKGRFLREARANSVLTSPHTVTVFDFGQAEEGELYLAMEMLEGESLGQRLKRSGRLSVEAAVDTARQALRSLAEAHAKGIIHRDLKPDNLFFGRVLNEANRYDEIVKVLDFGIAKMLRDEDSQMNAVETQAGTVFGTPRYMSPEQAQGKPLDARSDLYSLGVILYHMLTGRPPFTDDDAIVVMARHIKTVPRAPSEVCPEANIPPEVESVVMRVLAKEPNQRPESAEMLVQELARAVELGKSVTSGVRSISQMPVSVRPASIRTPPPALADESLSAAAAGVPSKRRLGLVLVLAGLVVGGGAAAGFYLGIVQKDPPPPAAKPPATATAAVTTPSRDIPHATVTATSTIPTLHPSALPVVRPSGKATAPPRGTGPSAPPPATATTTAAPPKPTAPAPTSKYQIFD